MSYVLSALGGLVLGGIVAWLLASARTSKSLNARNENLAQRASTAESRASGLEATIAGIR